MYISISSLWCRGNEQRRVPPLNTQRLQKSAVSGERSALTLGSVQREADFDFNIEMNNSITELQLQYVYIKKYVIINLTLQ